MLEQRLDLRLIQTEVTEPVMEVGDDRTQLRVVLDQRRLLCQGQGVLEREPAGLADQLGEEAGEAGNGVYVHARRVYPEGL